MEQAVEIEINDFPSADDMKTKMIVSILESLGDQLRNHNERQVKWTKIPNCSDFRNEIEQYIRSQGYTVSNEGFEWKTGPYIVSQTRYDVSKFPDSRRIGKGKC